MTTPFPAQSQRLRYRELGEADLEQLVFLYNSNPVYMQVSAGKPAVTLEEVRRDYAENKEYPDSVELLVSEADSGEIAGVFMFILNNPRDNQPWLGLLMLHSGKQGKGYAKECLQTLVDWLRENGFSSLHLGVLEANRRVVPIYEACGFQVYEVRETEKLGRVICMRRQW